MTRAWISNQEEVHQQLSNKRRKKKGSKSKQKITFESARLTMRSPNRRKPET
jgi:hypothetical protein